MQRVQRDGFGVWAQSGRHRVQPPTVLYACVLVPWLHVQRTGTHPTTMTASSHRDILARLGIRPGVRVWIGGHNLEAKRAVMPFLSDTVRPPTGPLDLAFIAPEAPDEAAYFLKKLSGRLPPGSTAWIVTTADSQEAGINTVSLGGTFFVRALTVR